MADGSSGSALAVERTIEAIPRRLAIPDPEQPRREAADQVFDVSDLVGSIRAHGVIQALWVRTIETCKDCEGDGRGPEGEENGCPVCAGFGARFMIILGERRWLGAGQVGLVTVPCEIHDELTLEEVREVQHIENVNRKDLTPLQEAASLGKLLKGRDVEALADRLGRPARHVRQRLALLELVPDARAALAAGQWTLGFALEVATLIPEAQQRVVQQTSLDDEGRDEPAGKTYRYLIKQARRRLVSSGIPLGDATLVPSAGACTSCPKRTFAQAELWADGTDKEDMCNDAPCFDAKLAAKAARTLAKVKLLGGRVLERPEALRLYPFNERLGDEGRRKVVDLEDDCDLAQRPRELPVGEGEAGRWKPPTWGEALGDLGSKVSVAVDVTGRAHEVVDRELAVVALREVHQEQEAVRAERGKAFYPRFELAKPATFDDEGTVVRETDPNFKPKKGKGKAKPAKPPTGPAVDLDLEDALDEAADQAALEQLVERAEAEDDTLSFWRFLAGLVTRTIDACGFGVVDRAAERRGIRVSAGAKSKRALLDSLVTSNPGACRGLIVELLSQADETGDSDDVKEVARRYYGVDLPAIRAELAAKRKAVKVEPPPKKGKTTRKGPRTAQGLPVVHDPALEAPAEPIAPGAFAPAATGTCKVCKCTNEKPCHGICCWTDETETLCSECAATMDQVLEQLIDKRPTRAELLDCLFEMLEPEEDDEARLDAVLGELMATNKVAAMLSGGRGPTRYELAAEASLEVAKGEPTPPAPWKRLIKPGLNAKAHTVRNHSFGVTTAVCGVALAKGYAPAPAGAEDCASCERMRESDQADAMREEAPVVEAKPTAEERATKLRALLLVLCAGAGRTQAHIKLGAKEYSAEEVKAELEGLRVAGRVKLNGKKWQGVK